MKKKGRPTRSGRTPAKAKKPTSRAARKAPARRRSPRSAPGSRKLAELSTRFEQLRKKLDDEVGAAKDLGLVLEEGERLIGDGYRDWVEKRLEITMEVARNHRRVLEVSRTNPALFKKYKGIGAAKMTRIGRVIPAKRDKALRSKAGAKSVRDMTDAEFNLATRPYLKKKPVITGNMLAHGLRMKVQAMVEQLSASSTLPQVDNGAIRTGLKADLGRLLKAAETVRKRLR